MKNKSTTPNVEVAGSADFKNMVELLGIYSDANNRLEELQAGANEDYLQIVDDLKPDYAKYQEAMTKAESALELLALRHPEWFTEKKTLKTPYGALNFHKSTSLNAANEEVSIVMIEKEIEIAESKKTRAITDGRVEAAQQLEARLTLLRSLLRQTTELNIEALEKCDDATLAEFRIKRVTKNNFSVKPAKVDLGKAVKESVAQKEAA